MLATEYAVYVISKKGFIVNYIAIFNLSYMYLHLV